MDCLNDYCTGTGSGRCVMVLDVDGFRNGGNCNNVWTEAQCGDPYILCQCPKKCRNIAHVPCDSIKCY